MRFIFVLATFFYACCCFAALNIFLFGTNKQTSDKIFYRVERTLQNDKVRDEEILNQCRNFTSKIVKHLNQRPIEEELQDILYQCSLILQKNSKLFVSKDENLSNLSQLLESHRSQEHNFSTDMHSTKESSKEANGKNTGTKEITSTSEESNNHRNLKIVPTTMNLKLIVKNPWDILFWNKDSSKSSHENQSIKYLERSPTKESSIYFENSTDLKNLTTENPSLWNLIMPGTKWCGAGNIAENDDDLGYFEDVDRCCRAHDKCNDKILPGVTKYNLTNTSRFTVLSCKCDDELYDCLGQINSVTSNIVGNTFFNILGRMCFMSDYPRICKKNSLLGCLEYVVDKTAKKVYQWKPAKKYIKKPFNISG